MKSLGKLRKNRAQVVKFIRILVSSNLHIYLQIHYKAAGQRYVNGIIFGQFARAFVLPFAIGHGCS